MNYLAIETSGDLLVYACVNGKKEYRHLVNCQTKHSLTLMPYVEELMQELNCTLQDFDFFVAVIGPGSFTGIRIGVATVKALCLATSKKAMALTSFDLLAYSDNVFEKSLCLVNANHGNFYCAGYENKKMTVKPCFLTKETIIEKYADYSFVSATEEDFKGVVIADLVSGLQNAIESGDKPIIDCNLIEPLYVKRSQAEEESC